MDDEARSEIIGIFPTPILFGRGVVQKTLVDALIAQHDEAARGANVRSTLLTHTPAAPPKTHDNYISVLKLLGPRIQSYGETLLGEQLNWAVKEIWINRMETGGSQQLHNHANSFVSGIIYLTGSHQSAATVFHRQVGQTSFQMSNANERCTVTPFNAPIFRVPPVNPGDVILFPSYIHHEVPPNQGDPRYTVAFNAMPERIDSWGYSIQFR